MRRLLALHDYGSDIGDYDRSAFRILGRAGHLCHTTFVLRQNLNLRTRLARERRRRWICVVGT
jgi:hypothetical protein